MYNNNLAKGKISVARNKKEALHRLEPTLEKFGQSSSGLQTTLMEQRGIYPSTEIIGRACISMFYVFPNCVDISCLLQD